MPPTPTTESARPETSPSSCANRGFENRDRHLWHQRRLRASPTPSLTTRRLTKHWSRVADAPGRAAAPQPPAAPTRVISFIRSVLGTFTGGRHLDAGPLAGRQETPG